jgi:hypothetical protein
MRALAHSKTLRAAILVLREAFWSAQGLLRFIGDLEPHIFHCIPN